MSEFNANQTPQQPSPYQAPQPGPFPQPQPPYFPPRKSHKLRTVAIVIGASFVGLIGLAALVPNSDPQSTPPAAVQTVDNGPTPDPITTPTNKPSVVEPTTQAPAPKPTKTAPKMTAGQEQAIGSAEQYLSFTAFSRKGLIKQLSSEYGEGFSVKDATYAVDHITVDWNEQAALKAKDYLSMQHFSRSGLIQQLESAYGEQFTHAQAVYGVNKAGL